MRDEHLDHIFMNIETFFRLKYFNSLMRMRVRDGKNLDPGSGINTGSATLHYLGLGVSVSD